MTRVAIIKNYDTIRAYEVVRETAAQLICKSYWGSARDEHKRKSDLIGWTDLSAERANELIKASDERRLQAVRQASQQHMDRVAKLITEPLE